MRSGQIRNLDSARVSMIGQVRKVSTDSTSNFGAEATSPTIPTGSQSHSVMKTEILEEDEEGEEAESSSKEPTSQTNEIKMDTFVTPDVNSSNLMVQFGFYCFSIN